MPSFPKCYSLFGLLMLGPLLLVTLTLFACGGESGTSVSVCDKSDVVLPALDSVPERIQIDFYVDATLSMMGFVNNPQSRYIRFLEEMEAAAGAGWKQTDIKYHKFGSTLREIRRVEYLSAKQAAFYSEKGIFESTNIDLVVSRTDPNRVSALITDLFQSQGDVNAIVEKIKEKCFLKHVWVAILAVPSQFTGKVYDANVPPYNYESKDSEPRSYRTFYALLFGNPQNISHLFQLLEARRLVSRDNSLLIAPHIIRDYTVTRIQKSKSSPDLNQRDKEGREFNLRSSGSSGSFDFDLVIEKDPLSPAFDPQNLKLVGFRNSAAPKQTSVPTISSGEGNSDFTLRKINFDGRQMHLNLDFKIDAPKGTYFYTLYLRVSPVKPFVLPKWVDELSSENPTPTKDSNKTFNLERFIRDLISASVSVEQPNVAKICLTIHRN